jgi:putative NADH-flavin reductase
LTTIAIFGVSGATGYALTAAARIRKWSVRGLCRISSVPPTGAVLIHGELHDPAAVRQTLEGADAVCCTLGPRAPYMDVFCADATRAIVAGMADVGCRRLVCITGAMIGPLPARSRPMEWWGAWFRRRRPAVARDREEQEAVVMQSGLDWTIVKPPRLTEDPPRGRVAAGPDLAVGLHSSLSRADLATFLLDEIAQPQFVHQRIIVQRGS